MDRRSRGKRGERFRAAEDACIEKFNQAWQQKHTDAAAAQRTSRKTAGIAATSAGTATTGKPGAQNRRSVVVNTASYRGPTADLEFWKCFMLAVRNGVCR